MEKNTIYRSIFIWFIILNSSVFAQNEFNITLIERDTNVKDTAYVGAFINSFYDFDIAEKSFNVDMWLWFLYKRKDLDLTDKIEIANSKDYTVGNVALDKTKDFQWISMRVKARIMKDWNVKNYPFDKQSLDVFVESQEFDSSAIALIPDTKNSSIDKQFKFNDWTMESFKLTKFNRVYNSTFGDQELKGESVYPAINISLLIKRQHSWLILLKLITGVIIAFMIASSVFWINPLNTDPRFGLCVGGLFAAVGNKYIVEGIIPVTPSNTLLDNIHNTTFVFIFVIIVLSIISLRLRELNTTKSIHKSIKLDKISYFSCVISYFTILTIFVVRAF